jgi:hypothetical protein
MYVVAVQSRVDVDVCRERLPWQRTANQRTYLARNTGRFADTSALQDALSNVRIPDLRLCYVCLSIFGVSCARSPWKGKACEWPRCQC